MSDSNATESITLRAATPADAPALALVGGATFLEAFTWMLPGADIVAHCARHHTTEAYTRYFADASTRITLALTAPLLGPDRTPNAAVGFAMLCTPELPSFAVLPTDIELKRIYLLSRFRNAPIAALADPELPVPDGLRPAQALLNAAITNALALGRNRILLGTHANNTRAIAFYLRNGFAEAGTRTFQVGSQLCSDLIFAKKL